MTAAHKWHCSCCRLDLDARTGAVNVPYSHEGASLGLSYAN